MEYIPSVITLLGVLLTVGVSLWLGLAKQKAENKSANYKQGADLTDDLLALINHYEKQIEQKDEQIRLRDERLEKRNEQLGKAQEIIQGQLEKITELNITVKQLRHDVQQLRIELDKFNRKVYYTKDK